MAPGMYHRRMGRTRLSLEHAVASHRRPPPLGADLRINSHTLGLLGSFAGAGTHRAIQAMQAGNQSIMHAQPFWKGKNLSVSVLPRPDLRVHSQSSVVMV